MAARKPSPHTRYRHARARLADLEAARDTLERARPRTRGKKAAKTRALNKLRGQLRVAKGLLTKARNAIAQAARSRSSKGSAAKQRRSEAAKKGWATRRARKAATIPIRAAPPGSNKAIPFLTREQGVIGVWPPSKADRSKVGRYWNAIDTFLGNGSRTTLDQFEGDSIFDEISGEHLPFVTDADVIYAHSEEFLFGISFYRDRHEFTKFA
jgi:hypothetical protein